MQHVVRLQCKSRILRVALLVLIFIIATLLIFIVGLLNARYRVGWGAGVARLGCDGRGAFPRQVVLKRREESLGLKTIAVARTSMAESEQPYDNRLQRARHILKECGVVDQKIEERLKACEKGIAHP